MFGGYIFFTDYLPGSKGVIAEFYTFCDCNGQKMVDLVDSEFLIIEKERGC